MGRAIISVDLPWPDKALMPNRAVRQHYAVNRKHKSAAREVGYVYALEKDRLANPRPPFHALFAFFPPDGRKRDLDNLLAAEKNYLDGVCKALGIDDAGITSITLQMAWVDKETPHVRLMIEEAV